jgi:hypothetical protein
MKSIREYAKIAGNENERWFVRLNESAQNKYTDSTANLLLDRLKSITESKDFASDDVIKKIRASKGHVIHIKEFMDASLCVDKLNSLVGKQISSKLSELQILIEFLQSRAQYFAYGFESGSYLITNLYMSLVLNVFHATATFILRGVDYVKTPRGEYEMKMKTFNMEDDVALSGLSSTVENIRNGKMDNFLKTTIKKESTMLKEDPIAIGVLAFFIIWLVLHVRDIIFLFLHFRKNVANWFISYAEYIEMHAQSISRDKKDVAKKQEAIAKRFRDVAEVFAVESDLANRSTLSVTRKQDIEVSSSARTAQSSDSGSIII